MRLANNITALTISTQMKKVNRYATASSLKLSSGKKVNSAKDDPAGLAIINRLSTKISVAAKNSENYSDGVSLLQTVDSAVEGLGDMIQRMRELSIQSASDTLTNEDRVKIQAEVAQLKDEINATSKRASFNGINFLSGDSTRLNYPTLVNPATDKPVVDYTYVSGNVPEGMLKYNVDSYGLPATTNVPNLTGTTTAGSDGKITINGYSIPVSATDTYDDIANNIKSACDATNISYFDGKLVTNDEGLDASILVTSEPAGFLGFPNQATPTVGTDAVITFDGLYALPDGTIPIPSFNNGLGITINGNEITMNGTNNQVLELTLDFSLNQTDGTPLYAGSATPITGAESSNILDSGQLKIQAGDNKASALDLYFRKLNTSTLRIDDVNLATRDGSNDAISTLDTALSSILSYRAEIGAYQNRLETANESLDDASVNMQTYLSTIQDTDMAYQMSYYTNQDVKMQAAIAILGQANQRPQQILSLLN